MEETKAPVQSLENFEMKKTLVALAALASVSAFAQSSVTMYGVLDLGYDQVKLDNGTTTKTTTTTGGNSSGALASNRLGFMGTEDLGGGMKANFVYELGITAGDGKLAHGVTKEARQSLVGLSGGMGSLTLGRQYTPIFLVSKTYDAGGANNLAYGRTVYGQVATDRASNLAIYTLPAMGGVTAKISYGTSANKVEETGVATTGTMMTGASLAYANGPLTVQYGYNKTNVEAVSTGDKKESLLGASYKIGSATLMAMTGNFKTLDVNGAQATKRSATQIGVSAPVSGNIEAFLTYGTAKVGTTSTAVEYSAKATQFGLINNLSKRTAVYGLYGSTEKESATMVKGTEMAIGIKHSF